MPLIGYRSINPSITIEERSGTTVSREDAPTRQKESRTAGSSEAAPGSGIVELPHLHLTEGPQIYHRGPLPAPDIISPPPLSCPVIRNPGAPTAHLFMSWHFFPPVSLVPLPSLAHTSLELDAPPPGTTRFLHTRDTGRSRPNFFLADA
ncbi:Uncharacterized protein DBV15_01090 [Temnothorax longispinosus]|uniref:Uncharacterized protein n=1 Tax=Temnothorax longispinosus TaxID=300112 RepID=A0A4S2J9V4_9HYME|nr:Uncharacterized protein DBV15_01090 [Temnothorax longispinosus]